MAWFSGSTGTKYITNVEMLGGIFSTGSNGQFNSLPVSGSDLSSSTSLFMAFGASAQGGNPIAGPGGTAYMLSSSFSGSSGSIIQALNYLHAKASSGDGDVVKGTVGGDNNVTYWQDASEDTVGGSSNFTFNPSNSNISIGSTTAGTYDAAHTTVDIGATSTFKVDSAGGASHIKHTATANGDFTLAMDAEVNASLILSSAGTDTDALQIVSTKGGMDISVQSTTAGDDLDIQSGTSVVISGAEAVDGSQASAGVADGAISLSAAAGGIGISWKDDMDLWAEGGRAIITANENAADAIKLHADAGNAQTITVVNDASVVDGTQGSAGVAAGAVNISATLGGVGISWADDKDLWAEGGRAVITANENAAEAIKLHADAGNAQTIVLQNDASVVDGTDGAGSILLAADAGGIGLAWHDEKDLWAEGGRAIITANENPSAAGDVIKLHADAGANQRIAIVNDEGTDAAAIALTATAGSVDIDAGANVTIDATSGISLDAGAASNFKTTAGNLTLENSHSTGKVIAKLGTATSATQFDVQTNVGNIAAKINAAGEVSGSATMKAFGYAMEGTNVLGDQKLFTLAVEGGVLTVTESAL